MKGKGEEIKKTFQLPAGKYVVSLDLIKVDSWFVWDGTVAVDLPVGRVDVERRGERAGVMLAHAHTQR